MKKGKAKVGKTGSVQFAKAENKIVRFSREELATVLKVLNTQIRAKLDPDVVNTYAEAMTRKVKFPQLVVYKDSDGNQFLADGFHRAEAVIQAGLKSFPVEIREGSQWDALLFSFKANGTHGLRLSNADKRNAVTLVLRQPQCMKKTDNAIAKLCGVSGTFVGDVRKELSLNEPEMAQTVREFERGGKKMSQNTEKIGSHSRRKKDLAADSAGSDSPGSNAAGHRNSAVVSSDTLDTVTCNALISPLETEKASTNDDFMTKATAQVTSAAVNESIDSGDEIESRLKLGAPSDNDSSTVLPEFFKMFSGREFEYLFDSEDDDYDATEILVFRVDGRRAEKNKRFVRALFKRLGGSILATKPISTALNNIEFCDMPLKEQLEIASEPE